MNLFLDRCFIILLTIWQVISIPGDDPNLEIEDGHNYILYQFTAGCNLTVQPTSETFFLIY